MSCALENELTAYLDGELSPSERARVDTHLPGCPDCRATLALLERSVATLHALPAFEPSPQLRRAVLQRVSEEGERGLGARWSRLRAAWVLPAFATAAAAGVLAFMLTHSSRQGVMEALEEPGGLELAANLEVVGDMDVLGMDRPEDVEVVARLDELEEKP